MAAWLMVIEVDASKAILVIGGQCKQCVLVATAGPGTPCIDQLQFLCALTLAMVKNGANF